MNFAKLLRGWWRALWPKPGGPDEATQAYYEMHAAFIDPAEEIFYECDA